MIVGAHGVICTVDRHLSAFRVHEISHRFYWHATQTEP